MNVRLLAYDVLKAVIVHHKYSNIELNNALSDSTLSAVDKRLTTTIVYGTIQHWHVYLEHIHTLFQGKKISLSLHVLFALSWYQTHFLERIPDYAIVNDAVEIAKNRFDQPTARFVNAMMRLMLAHPFSLTKEEVVLLSHPQWMVKMMNHQWGIEHALQMMNSNLMPPEQHVRVRLSHPLAQQAIEQLHLTPGKLSATAYRYHEQLFLGESPFFLEGVISYQDEASQSVVAKLQPLPGDRILDLCAAPGSKSCQMAELTDDQAIIVAVDIHPHRVALIHDNVQRLHLKRIHPLIGDATQLNYNQLGGKFDKILLDAPCSGLGVIRRKPDVLLKADGNYMDELLVLQSTLLDHAITLLKDQGTLMYSTCTWNKKENQRQVQAFLARHSEMELVEEHQLLGYDTGTDAFYMALMRKR